MKKIIFSFVIITLIFQSLAASFIFFLKPVYAQGLTSDIFPSALEGLNLSQTSAQRSDSCFGRATGFISASYRSGTYGSGRVNVLTISLSQFDSSQIAEEEARDCLAKAKQQYSKIPWGATQEITISGYKSIATPAPAPAEKFYAAIIYTIAQNFLIASVYFSNDPNSLELTKRVNGALINKLSLSPNNQTQKKANGEFCNANSDCQSSNCRAQRCCASGKECCQGTYHCRARWYCDLDEHYCSPREANGRSCQNSDYCQSGYCGKYGQGFICCNKTEAGCCKNHEDCGPNYHCQDFTCVKRNEKGSVCGLDSECLTNFCYQGKCDNKPSNKLKNGVSCTRDINCESNTCDVGPHTNGQKYCCQSGYQECCNTHSDCAINQYCEPKDAQCHRLRSEGEICSDPYQCLSGYCQDGRCKKRPVKEIVLKEDGGNCIWDSDCKSNNCQNRVCCFKGHFCCQTDYFCQHNYAEFSNCRYNYCLEDESAKEEVALAHNGICEPKESCKIFDCSTSTRCLINEACAYGGEFNRAAVGCIASIASELHIVAKVADLIQGVGCDIMGNFISGLLGNDIDKLTSGLAALIYTSIDLGLELNKAVKLVLKIIQCIDGHYNLSRPVIIKTVDTLVAVVSAVTGQNTAAVSLKSPALLLITDSAGKTAGIDETGNFHEDIPGSTYIEFPKADIKMVILTNTNNNYTVQTKAEEAGKIGIGISQAQNGEVKSVEYNDVNQDAQTKTKLIINNGLAPTPQNLEVINAAGQVNTKPADKVSKNKVEVPDKYKAAGLLYKLKKLVTSKFFIIIITILILLAAFYIFKRRRNNK